MELVVEGVKYHENLIKIMQIGVPFISQSFVSGTPHYVGENGLKKTKTGIQKIGVFDHLDAKRIGPVCKDLNIDVIHLLKAPTKEEMSELRKLKKKLWLEVEVDDDFDFSKLATEEFDRIDAFVFRLKDNSDFPNWFVLEDYKGSVPFYIKGNLGLRNLYTLQRFQNSNCAGVIINEAFESIPGIKNGNLVATFKSNLAQLF